MNFEELDKSLNFLPQDLSKIIYDYYDASCKECNVEKVFCLWCEEFYCYNNDCIERIVDDCSSCKKKIHTVTGKGGKCNISFRICICCVHSLCERCWYNHC